MTQKEKIELLKFSIDRFDHFYDSINNKGNLYLTLCTFLLGGLVTGYYSIKDDLILMCFPISLIWFALFLNGLCITITLLAINPYLSKRNKIMAEKSLFYFGDISSITPAQFKNRYNNAETSFLYEDLVFQLSSLSKGLRRKFKLLQFTTYVIIAEFITITIIAFYILK